MKNIKIVKKWYFKPFICVLIVFLCLFGITLGVKANTLEGYEKDYREVSYYNPDYIEFGYDDNNVAIFTGIDTNSALDEWNDYYLLGDKDETPVVSDEFVGTWVLNESLNGISSSSNFGENVSGFYLKVGQDSYYEISSVFITPISTSNYFNINASYYCYYYYANSNSLTGSFSFDSNDILKTVEGDFEGDLIDKTSAQGVLLRTIIIEDNYSCSDTVKSWFMANATKQDTSTSSSSSLNFQINRQNTKYLNSSATAYRVESVYDTTNVIKSIDVYFNDLYVTKNIWSNLSQLVPCYKYYNSSTESYVNAYVDYSFDIEFYTPLKETSDQVNKFHSYNYSSTYLGSKLYYLPQYVSVSSYLTEQGISSDDLEPNQIFRLRNVKISYSVPEDMQIEYEYSFESDEFYGNNYRDLSSNYYTYSTYSGLVSSLLLGVNNFLAFELVPGLSLFSIMMMALVIPLLIWLLKVFLGG